MKTKKPNLPKLETCKFVPLTSLVPQNWTDWFYEFVSQDAPFSWGDNNRTLVTAKRLAEHCGDQDLVDAGATQKEADAFMAILDELFETYIDLEN